MAGGAHHKGVAEPLVEDDLGGKARVGATENDGERVLHVFQCEPVFDSLRRVRRFPGNKAFVTCDECCPRFGRSGGACHGVCSRSSRRVGGFAPGRETVMAAMRADC